MIEVQYVYIAKSGKCTTNYAYFHRADKALQFIYKCIHSKNMVFTGQIGCDDPFDLEYINKRLK